MMGERLRMLLDHNGCISYITDNPLQRLVIACLEGNTEFVQRWLTFYPGRVNEPINGSNGMTALHYCAQGGQLPLLDLLLDNGAIMTKNESGETPLTVAALNGHHTFVDDMIARNLATPEEQAEALELLGVWYTTCIVPHYDYAVTCWSKALELRTKVGLVKHRPQIAAYLNAVEVQTMDEYMAMKENSDRINMQALFFCEHELGPSHQKTISESLFFASNFEIIGNYKRCMSLRIHILKSLLMHQNPLSENILDVFSSLARLFSKIVDDVSEPEPERSKFGKQLNDILKLAHDEVQRSQEALREENVQPLVGRLHGLLTDVIYLIDCIDSFLVSENATKSTPLTPATVPAISTIPGTDLSHDPTSSLSSDSSMSFLLHKAVYNLVKTEVRGEGGATLLHMACEDYRKRLLTDKLRGNVHPGDPSHTTNISTIKILLKSGANPNVRNDEGSTPLLMVLLYDYRVRLPLVRAMLDAGAHVDMCHSTHRISLLDILKANRQTEVACPVASTTLQCLAARNIAQRRMRCPGLYRAELSQELEDFVSMH